jgi:hypothetical protein
MKIRPYTERWNEGERDWRFVKDARADIEAWEKREGLSLPEPYRTFMLRYNGGRVSPRTFRTEAGVGMMLGPYVCESEENYCDLILSWDSVVKHWRREIFGPGVPPHHLLFAQTPGSIELLMALTPESYGRIYAWVHTNWIWGEEGNNVLFPLANDFREFLSRLYDNPAETGDGGQRHDTLAKELELD